MIELELQSILKTLEQAKGAMVYAYEDHNDQYYLNVKNLIEAQISRLKEISESSSNPSPTEAQVLREERIEKAVKNLTIDFLNRFQRESIGPTGEGGVRYYFEGQFDNVEIPHEVGLWAKSLLANFKAEALKDTSESGSAKPSESKES